ncbi:hypothetical protein ES703_35564 [subsurface metagenome]
MHYRGPADDFQVAYLGKVGQNIIGDAVAEPVTFFFAEVDEGEYGDGLCTQRRLRAWPAPPRPGRRDDGQHGDNGQGLVADDEAGGSPCLGGLFLRWRLNHPLLCDVKGPGQGNGDGEADQQQDNDGRPHPVRDREIVKGAIDDLDNDERYPGIDHRHPEHPAALELGDEGGNF